MDLLGYITIMVIPVTLFILGILFTVKPVTKKTTWQDIVLNIQD